MRNYQLIFIGPFGFSGSTLLDFALSESPEIVSTGEMFQLGEWIKFNNLCTCRTPVLDCQFWSEIVDDMDPLRIQRPSRIGRLEDYKSVPFLDDPSVAEYASLHWEMIDKIATRSGASYIIDSSKHLWRLRALAMLRPESIKFLHLHRSPFVVADSAKSSKAQPAVRNETMTRPVPYYRSLVKWVLTNRAAVEFSKRAKISSYKVEYEDLCERPRENLLSICNWLGVDYVESMVCPSTAGRHNIAGSRWRMKHDQVTIGDQPGVNTLGVSKGRLENIVKSLGGIR